MEREKSPIGNTPLERAQRAALHSRSSSNTLGSLEGVGVEGLLVKAMMGGKVAAGCVEERVARSAATGRGLGLKNLATGNAVKSSHTEFSHNWEEF